MNNENGNKYIENRRNRIRNYCHWRLALIWLTRLLFIPLLPIVILACFIWSKMEQALTFLDIPNMLSPVYLILARVLGILIPFLLVWGLIDMAGTLLARKDEADIKMAFPKSEVEYGLPILMGKWKDRKSGIITYEWYSPISMKLWNKHREEIEERMKIRILGFRYRGKAKGNQIAMYSKKSQKAFVRDVSICDKELEKDMECIGS